MLPYGQIYHRNTQVPISTIIHLNDETEIQNELLRWFKVKLREAQYVQVAVRESSSSSLSQDLWQY